MPFLTLLALAWRNLWRRARRTIITGSTIAVGLALAVMSVGLGDGGHNQMIRNGIRTGAGHLALQPESYLAAPANHKFLEDGEGLLTHPPLVTLPGTTAPRVVLDVLVSSATNASGGQIRGIEPASDPLESVLRPHLVEGEWPSHDDDRGIVIGSGMAERLDVGVGGRLVLRAAGGDAPVQSRLARVRGIYETGLDEMDGYFVVSALPFARPLLPGYDPELHAQALTRIAIFLDDLDATEAWKQRLQQPPLPPGVALVDWQEMMPDLVNFIVLDDIGNYVWLIIILVVVAFGILNTLLMGVLERTREFGLERALGLRARHLLALVLTETLLLAVASVAAGWVLGGAGHAYLAIVGIDLSGFSQDALSTAGVFMDPVLKSELSWTRVGVLTGIVLGVTLLAGVYPAVRAARVTPLEAMRT